MSVNAFCNDCCFVYSLFNVTFYDLCYVPKRSPHTWGVSQALKNVMFSLPQVNSSIFLGFIIYCIVWGMSKIPIGRYRGLSGGKRANRSFFSTLFTWWRIWWMLGACRTHPSHSCWFECLLLCVMTFELLHKIFLQNYHQVYFTLSFSFLAWTVFNEFHLIYNDTLWLCLKGMKRMHMNECLLLVSQLVKLSLPFKAKVFKKTQMNHLDVKQITNHEEYHCENNMRCLQGTSAWMQMCNQKAVL